METSADMKAALAATAKVCEKCKGSACKHSYWHEKPCRTCPHCVNGIQFSDERARELLERLERAEEIVASYNSMKAAEVPFEVQDQLRAARAKEGAYE